MPGANSPNGVRKLGLSVRASDRIGVTYRDGSHGAGRTSWKLALHRRMMAEEYGGQQTNRAGVETDRLSQGKRL
jgi:hypothetical protein